MVKCVVAENPKKVWKNVRLEECHIFAGLKLPFKSPRDMLKVNFNGDFLSKNDIFFRFP